MIPADLRILQARDLFVAQASLTGESLPVEKPLPLASRSTAIRWSATPCVLWAPPW